MPIYIVKRQSTPFVSEAGKTYYYGELVTINTLTGNDLTAYNAGDIQVVNGDPEPSATPSYRSVRRRSTDNAIVDAIDVTQVLFTPTSGSSTTDASTLTSGTLSPARLANGSVPVSKLATDPLARANHTGTQPSTTISDIQERIQDEVAAFFGATGATLTYNDAGNAMLLAVPPGTTDPEAVRDAIGAALLGVGNITVSINDAADTISISTTATANSTDAALRDRNTHTGTQLSTTISDLPEAVQDIVAAALKKSDGSAVTYNDVAGTITLPAAGGGVLEERLLAPGDIIKTVGTLRYPITSARTLNLITPSCRDDRKPSGRAAIAGVRRDRGGVVVDLFTSNATRPTIAADASKGTGVAPDQNAALLAGDDLLLDIEQGGFAQEAAGFLGAWAQNGSAATSGGSFSVARPVATNEIMVVTLAGATGNYTLGQPGGATSAAIGVADTAAVLQTKLEAVYGAGNVSVTGANGGPYTVTFIGALATVPQRVMNVGTAGLTAGSVTVTRTIAGNRAMVYNDAAPSFGLIALWRDNTTTTVTPPTGVNLVQSVDGAGGRCYLFSLTDDVEAASWTFTQSGVAGQVAAMLWAEPPASTASIDAFAGVANASSADFAVPALTTAGEDRSIFAAIFSATGPDHRDVPPTGSWLSTFTPVGGRIGFIRRYPGTQVGAMGPYTGGKFKDAANADTARTSAVIAVAVTPRKSEPGADFMLTLTSTLA
jgi:hypothetical protein